MKNSFLVSGFILVFCLSVFSQKMTEPELLGSLTYGEDPSEFLLHTVMQRSHYYLEDNPDGKLIIRICSSEDFATAFVRSVFNPLSASNYNGFTRSIIVPYEKIYIAKASKCARKDKVVFTQHWFVPDKNTLETDEMFPVNDISYKAFSVNDYNYKSGKGKSKSEQNKDFKDHIREFVDELKTNPAAQGFIVHNSKNGIMKRNIEKVKSLLNQENISPQRVKIVVKIRLDIDKNEKLMPVRDEKKHFPNLEVLAIKK